MANYAPLRERVFYGQVGTPSNSLPRAYSFSGLRPAKYKDWSHEGMAVALRTVVEGGMSVREAALCYGIPKSTLGDRVSGRVIPGSTGGPPKYLTSEEEEELVNFLCRTALVGYARTRKELLTIIERILSSRGVDKHVSSGWWASFIA